MAKRLIRDEEIDKILIFLQECHDKKEFQGISKMVHRHGIQFRYLLSMYEKGVIGKKDFDGNEVKPSDNHAYVIYYYKHPEVIPNIKTAEGIFNDYKMKQDILRIERRELRGVGVNDNKSNLKSKSDNEDDLKIKLLKDLKDIKERYTASLKSFDVEFNIDISFTYIKNEKVSI